MLSKIHADNRMRGFSLVELLITIAIIGILSSTVTVSLTSAKTKAVNATIQSSLKQIATIASDPDNLSNGDETALTCGQIFTDPEITKLIEFIDTKNGETPGEQSSNCAKSNNEYNFIVLAPKYKNPDTYFCVDHTSSVLEIPSTHIDWSRNTRMCQTSGTPPAEYTNIENQVPPALTYIAYNAGESSFTLTYTEAWSTDLCPGLVLYNILDEDNITTATYYHPCGAYIPSGNENNVTISLSGFEDMGHGFLSSENMCIPGHHYLIEITGSNFIGQESQLTSTSMSSTIYCQ